MNQQAFDKDEENFRKENLKHSFRASLFTGVGVASFFGVLSQGVKIAIDAIGGAGASTALEGAEAAADTPIAAPTEALTTALYTGGAMAGFMGIGAASYYMAESERTTLKMIGDKHLAKMNAMQREQEKADNAELVAAMGEEMKEAVEEVHARQPQIQPVIVQAAPATPTAQDIEHDYARQHETPDSMVNVTSISGLARQIGTALHLR